MKMNKTLFALVLLGVIARTGITAESGWISLFNGKDLSGWTVRCQPKDQGKSFWQAEAGVIVCDSLGRPDHNYCWLVSEKEFGDFELTLKFQAYTNSPGNSGMQFRNRYDANDKDGWMNGPQADLHPRADQTWRNGLIYDETRGEQHWVSPSLPDSNLVRELDHGSASESKPSASRSQPPASSVPK